MDNPIDPTASDSDLLIKSLLSVSSENEETINDSEDGFVMKQEQQELEPPGLQDVKWDFH